MEWAAQIDRSPQDRHSPPPTVASVSIQQRLAHHAAVWPMASMQAPREWCWNAQSSQAGDLDLNEGNWHRLRGILEVHRERLPFSVADDLLYETPQERATFFPVNLDRCLLVQ